MKRTLSRLLLSTVLVGVCLSFTTFLIFGGEAKADGTFTITVKGTFNDTLNGPKDRASFSRQAGMHGVPASFVLKFVRFDQQKGAAVNVIFYLSGPPKDGKYNIEVRDSLIGSVIANFSDRASLSTFGSSPQGTVTIRRKDNTYSGNFSFTAKKTFSHDSVTVEGEFKGLTLADAKP